MLYGCGDFLNDYEGIQGYEECRDDLALGDVPAANAGSGALQGLRMMPFQIRNFRLIRASAMDMAWLARTLNREGARFGTRVVEDGEAA